MLESNMQNGEQTASTSEPLDGVEREESLPFVTKVLVADADRALRAAIGQFLRSHGFLVFEADSGPAARALLASRLPDVVILDVLIPGDDGLSIARDLSVRSNLTVILLSALASEMDRIIGLEAGADDYIAKPVSLRELLARIRAVRRRGSRIDQTVERDTLCYRFAGWRLDVERRELRDPAHSMASLSDGEFAVLRAFVERPQRVLTRDQLLEFARGPDSDAYDRAIDTQISRLRRKLGGRSRDDLIRTVRSEGYMFVPKVEIG
jgi:two-component system OmpR family response regulator